MEDEQEGEEEKERRLGKRGTMIDRRKMGEGGVESAAPAISTDRAKTRRV